MKVYKAKDFKGGWFIGDFEPNIVRAKEFEAGLKVYNKGDIDPVHFHKIAKEFTIIVSGKHKLNETVVSVGDIVVLEPKEKGKFECLEDGAVFVIKIPSVLGDKYLV